MVQIESFERLVVIAPHPDDEVLGAGGTIARLAEAGTEIVVVIVTRGMPPQFNADFVSQVRSEAEAAHAKLGVSRTIFLDLPAAALDQVPHADVNRSIAAVLRDFKPEAMLIPFVGDIHLDHQLIFLSSLVAARPYEDGYPRFVLSYETLSETNWNAPHVTPSFLPNVYVDISATLDTKIEAMRCYASQCLDHPHERSIETVRALATLRGSTVYLSAAEAFMLIRAVV